MNIEYKEFIGLYKNVYPEGYCQHMINEFERLVEGGVGYNRQKSENALKHNKDDMQLFLNIRIHQVVPFQDIDAIDMFFNGLQQCYESYTNRFSVLKDAVIHGTAMKMQRTSPGGGYHIWHSEQGGKTHAERVLVYMLYLNSLTDKQAGETEFLYQQLRIKPEENTMVIWPAAYTHAHRGNVVHGENSKYIVTGWFYYD